MIRSFYTATSGAITEQRNLNVVSNNIANMGTIGFKKDIAVSNTFEEKLIYCQSAQNNELVGAMSLGKYNDEVLTNHGEGNYEVTGRNLDFAIKGTGYFQVLTPNGEERLTRDGQFIVDNEGYLALGKGGRVLNDLGEPIYLGTSNFEVNGFGDLYMDGQYYDRIGVVEVVDTGNLTKVDEGLFMSTNQNNQYIKDNPQVLWKTLEKSNVNMTQEMTQSLSSARQFQSCSQMMKMIDLMTQKTVTEIAKL